MAEEATLGLVVGDRSQGYEVRGPSAITGLDAAYAGVDGKDRDTDVTLIWLSDNQSQSAVFDSARAIENLDQKSLIGARTVVRFGAGLAAVIGKEQGAPLDGETFERWLKRHAPISPERAAALFVPILDALTAMHGQGHAHGMLSASHLIVGRDGALRLLGSWLPNGGGPAAMVAAATAPELNGGDKPNPASDVYSLSALLIWALSGEQAPSAEARTAARAQHDDDPFVPLSESTPTLDPTLANVVDTGMRLHPAVRPQGFAALKEALSAQGKERLEPQAKTADGPPPLPPGASKAGSTTPPPLPKRGGGVPTIPRQSHTSTIGEKSPTASGTQPSQPRKRKIGLMTVVTFVIALAVAWFVASDGQLFSNDDEGITRESQPTVEANRPNTTTETPSTETQVTEPRKGPARTNVDEGTDAPSDEIDTAADGVVEQFCGSTFIYNQARDGGTEALRAYIDRCEGIDGPFVDDARRELGR